MRRLAALLVLLLALVPAVRAEEPGALRAGFATVSLAPAHAVPLGGYADREGRPSTGLADDVAARAMVLEQDGTRLGLVSVDLVGVSARLRTLLRDRVADLALDDLVLAATHNHAGPGALSDVPLWRPAMGAFQPRHLARTAARIELALRRAAGDLAPVVRVAHGRIAVPGRQRNRATEGGPVDEDLRLLALWGPDGALRATIAHHAAHPTLVGADEMRLGGGWPAALCRALEAARPGSHALFLAGALGDIAPVAPEADPDRPEAEASDDHVRARRHGEHLAAKAAALLADLAETATAPGRLVVEGTRAVYAHTAVGALLGRPGASALAPEAPWALPVARVHLGDLTWVTVPGEPTHAVGRAMGQGADRWVVACAQDHLGYFADRALFRRGGYEAEMSFFGPDVGDRLAAAADGRFPAAPPVAAPPALAPRTPVVVAAEAAAADPARSLGRAHGARLAGPIRELYATAEARLRQEAVRRGAIVPLLPHALALRVPPADLLMPLVLRAARRMQPHVPGPLLDEMEALAEAAGVPYDAVLLANVLLTLAEQPDALALLDLPPRCTNVVVTGEATSMGQLLHGSTLDWGFADVLRPRVTPIVMVPATGHPFLSVTWPGMVGTLRALGAQGIAVSEESCAAEDDDTTHEGIPVNLLMRQVVQHADSLEEAVDSLRAAPGTCGYKVTVSDGRALAARVVALTARRSQVRAPLAGILPGCAPTDATACFVGPADPAIPRSDGSSRRRYPALHERLEAAAGHLREEDVMDALGQTEGGILDEGTILGCLFEPQLGRYHLATRDDLDPEAGRMTFRPYDLLADLPEAVRARYAPPWPVAGTGPVEVEPRVAPPRIEGWSVTFTSPVRSGHPTNDRFTAELYVPEDPAGVVIQLPHWKDDSPASQRLVAMALVGKGLAVMLLPLPYQYGRAPAGTRSGDWTLSSDLARTREATMQGVADVVRAGLWLEEARGFTPDRQAVMGISLGGHFAAVAMGAHPDRFAAGAFLLAGAEGTAAILEENGITDGIRRRLLARGVTPAEAEPLVGITDPGRWARPGRPEDVLVVAGTEDRVVPPARAKALARAWGGARVRLYEGGHYGIVRHLPTILAEVAEHVRSRFEAQVGAR